MPNPQKYPTTPDGRYFVVNGRLWRATNPGLSDADVQFWVSQLMRARQKVKEGLKSQDAVAESAARAAVDAAKRALGERGPVWWSDGEPDLNRRMVASTSYRDWYNALRR